MADQVPVFVICPTRGWRFLDLRELWSYRELIYFLTWRGIKVRYKQTAIGVAWAVVQPLAFMAVFSLALGRLAKVPGGGAPYAAFALSALVVWMFLQGGVSFGAASLLSNRSTTYGSVEMESPS